MLSQDVLIFAHEVLLYVSDVFDLSSSSEFDEGTFQVYQSIGRDLSARASTNGQQENLTVKLASELNSNLDTFNASWQLHCGLGMELLWTTFRPVSAKGSHQLESSNRVKDLAIRFDALKWDSGMSSWELCSLQSSIAGIHEDIKHDLPLDLSSLEVRKHHLVPRGADLLTTIQDVQKALRDLENRSQIYQSNVSPYLESHFQTLCQYKACAPNSDVSESDRELRLFAGQPTARYMRFGVSLNAWEAISRIQLATAVGHSVSELAAVRNILPTSMLRDLGNIREVPLKSLRLLCGEIGSISRFLMESSATVNGEPLHGLRILLLDLGERLSKALRSKTGFPNLEKTKEALDQLLHQTSHHRGNVDGRTQHLHTCLERAFCRQQPDISVVPTKPYQDDMHLSIEFVQTFTGCLLLYVPDQPCDPAMKPVVERNRHRRRRSELENRLQALQDFELVFSGQKMSFRSHLVEKRIHELGSEPEVPLIFRPQVSELGQLQAEFNHIVMNVILRSPTPKMLQSIVRQESAYLQEVELLRLNIAQAVSRLSNGFEAYEDLTKPLIGFLQGLDVGLALSLLISGQQNHPDESVRHICEMTPFMGLGPQGLAGITIADLEGYRLQNLDLRLHFLKCTGMACYVGKNPSEAIVRTMIQTFDSFYREWKEQLGRDQRRNVANSSLYRYRGGEEESIRADEQEFHSLFPSYDRPDEEGFSLQGSVYGARDQAQRLAGLQRGIFSSVESASERLLVLLGDASQDISRLWKDKSKLSRCSMPAENIFSALVVCVDQHRERLLGHTKGSKLYNFYTDSNLAEAQRLIALVQKIQAKYLDLQEAWPEHATLADVLRTSSDLMALRHIEPIAKILTKAEQLHGYMHQWQIVTSRRYTAATLYDQLTDLLVSWRRLELSTWARLLDMEDQKCNEDADSWWFVAYEVIIAAPLSMVNEGDDLQMHVEQLFVTLAEFMEKTSIGQYVHRLGMIDCFRSHLEVIARNIHTIGVVHSAVTNFLNYYARFANPVQEHLRKGRQKLEKDMREILLFASWKDTNINALRDSAKRSHHKLFKVIRKYRALLTESAETLMTQGFSSESDISAPSKHQQNIPAVTGVDSGVVETCRIHLENWESKPERFKNSVGTAQRMSQMSQLPLAAINAISYLDSFGTNLIDSIKDLQKETPSKATKANEEATKHLKARKRKLYAETLRSLRHMGFRSNLSTDVIRKQSSPSIVLANTPAIATKCHPQIASAEYHLHQLLRIIPPIKERSRSHSEDLNHSEVARSMGYLDSVLFVILEQRKLLATASIDLHALNKTTDMVSNLWSPDSYTLKISPVGLQKAATEVQHALRWLPGIIEVGSIIIEKHGNMGKIDHSSILADLRGWKDKMTGENASFDQLPELSPNLSSSQHEKTYHKAARVLKEFKSNMQKLTENSPSLGFVLKQIAQWSDVDTALKELQMDEEPPTSLVSVDTRICRALNSILVAMQHMQDRHSAIPSSDEDATWLLDAEFCLARSLKDLNPRKIGELLQEAVGQMQHLSAANDRDVPAAGALFALALPIIQQFRDIVQTSFDRYVELHRSLCMLAHHLARSFLQVIQDGFCSPAEDSAAEAGRTEKVESGTGLGEGEGTEDISKDIQDEEDLSDLAQGTKTDKEKEEIQDQEDAVNMDHDELEGEMNDMSDEGKDDRSATEGEETDIDEETGDIDSLDPSAVDEKLWDGKAGEADKEKEGPKNKGKVEKTDQAADDATNERECAQMQEEGDDDEVSQNDAEGVEDVAQEETEKVDPYLQEGQNLDLPEQMDLDNIDGIDTESVSGDSDMEGMSDIEQEKKESDSLSEASQDSEMKENTKGETDAEHQPNKDNSDLEVDGAEEAGSPVDTEPNDEEPADDPRLLQDAENKQNVGQEDSVPSDSIGLGQKMDQTDAEDPTEENKAQGKDGVPGYATSVDEPQAGAEEGQLGELDVTEGGHTDENPNESRDSQAFKRLGDALEKWHRQISQIQDAPAKEPSVPPKPDVDMLNHEFEHLHDEETEADTQALGAASVDQAKPLDKKAMDSEMQDESRAFLADEIDEQDGDQNSEHLDKDIPMQSAADQQQEQSRPGAFVAERNDSKQPADQPSAMTLDNQEDIDDLDNDLSTTHLQPDLEPSPLSAEHARLLWSHYESLTRDLSLSLTEQLRLILAPTLATKLRGDFRTGKRLNIKRIIPYIASQYKRDKIWMRRSIPSKRNYQIMLAVDDSKSMLDSGSARLAFETLALVSRSLSMLEVGEICIVGFGNQVRVAHDFGKTFSSDAGAEVFRQFGFQQNGTNVRKLVADSITLFREARRKAFNATAELWQLELIISDGLCEDHDTIRRLVRQAQEEQIMIVFIIVDALLKDEESIVDMNEAAFEPDAVTGETKLKLKRYLDGFPFPYYLVVGDVRELPGVLAKALRQWFAEVVENGG